MAGMIRCSGTILKKCKTESLTRAGEFILASGRSYRDYETLARAVKGTEVNVKVSGRPFNLAGVDLPQNMETTGWLTHRELQHYLHETISTWCPFNLSLMPAATAACSRR